ncbi:MAG: glutamate synthase subunit beta [Deltaproteobacteria bacterium]|jgi:glutamate synthase (NADPH/NADH) small chain|nr:glutamate synthase subunit beta [Deltaproteobacteria bacterium]
MSRYRPIAERIKDYKPVELRLNQAELTAALKHCQDCGIPFCHADGCTLANLIPEINNDALCGRWESALARLLETNPFPEFTGRICPALCEGACVQALNEEPVPDRLVELEVIERAFEKGLISPVKPERSLDFDVGVVGSGPAGLACAHALIRAGAAVTVYERDLKAGGFLRYGIPDFKLEKSVIDRRLDLMKREGVRFLTGVEAGVDISARLLRKRHQVLILAVGARKKRDLNIPGRDLNGVFFATDYLSAQNKVVGGELEALPPSLNAAGRKVVVIGGGDTGSDCMGTAWRQGASEVWQFEIMPRPPLQRGEDNPWPQWPRILRTSSSHLEGGRRLWNVTTLEFLANSEIPSLLRALRCQEVEWEIKEGKLIRPIPKPGSEFIREADLVLLAMGFTGPESSPLISESSPKPDSFGRIEPGLYVTGDAYNGPSLVVRAINEGLKTAATVIGDRPDYSCLLTG